MVVAWLLLAIMLRLVAIVFWLLSAAYAIVCYSPFAYDMFIRPGLVVAVNEFAAWHHVWFLVAYSAAVASFAVEGAFRAWRSSSRPAGRALAIGYAVVIGAGSLWLVNHPILPYLQSNTRSLVVSVVFLVPLIWLAAIDHARVLAPGPAVGTRHDASSRQALAACVTTAGILWSIHVLHARLNTGDGDALAWTFAGAWALGAALACAAIVWAALSLIESIAEGIHRPDSASVLSVGLMAVCAGEFLRRLVLPTIAIDGMGAAILAATGGTAIALTWSGLMRRLGAQKVRPALGLDVLSLDIPHWIAGPTMFAVPVCSILAVRATERYDWQLVIQRTIVVAEAALVFAIALGAVRGARRLWSPGLGLGIAIAGAALVAGVPRAGLQLAARPSSVLERHAAADPLFKLLTRVAIQWPGEDPKYYRYLQVNGSPNALVTIPEVKVAEAVQPPGRTPDIFVFVVDSLRRDYVSPYNDAVTFTPHLQSFAKDAFAFRNAFTRHGGTELAIPSIWAGVTVMRRAKAPGFERMNALEKLLLKHDYRVAINDFTVANLLTAATPVTVIDPDVPSVDTDLCQNLHSLQQHLDTTAGDTRPVFTFLAPMNVHILNTRQPASTATAEGYGGFYAPYASRLERIDACFGAFISYLKARGRYDNSIVVVTSDHGDSLGEDGYWGHAYWLFPEGVQIPLIIRLPERLRTGVTTDLARVAFSTDIVPTLYGLFGQPFPEAGTMHGAPLFVPRTEMPHPRRRESFLLTSSYAATYGILRRNGTALYVSDLYERQEFAFLMRGTRRRHLVVDDAFRRSSQALIRTQVAETSRFYRVSMAYTAE